MNPTPTPLMSHVATDCPDCKGENRFCVICGPTPTPNSPAPVDIARLRELLAKATPGPWIKDRVITPSLVYWTVESETADGQISEVECIHEPDATLIAALRNEAPALLDEVTELRARVSSEVSIADALADQLHEDKPALAALVAERDRARKDADSNAANGMKAIEALERMTKENNGLLSERDKLREEVERLQRELKAKGDA